MHKSRQSLQNDELRKRLPQQKSMLKVESETVEPAPLSSTLKMLSDEQAALNRNIAKVHTGQLPILSTLLDQGTHKPKQLSQAELNELERKRAVESLATRLRKEHGIENP